MNQGRLREIHEDALVVVEGGGSGREGDAGRAVNWSEFWIMFGFILVADVAIRE